MKKSLITIVLLSGISSVYAKKNCTSEPREKWMSEEQFKAKVEAQGYKIKKFKQPGSCYEIYGSNKEGKKVEIYFNPVDASVVKEKVE